VVDERALHGLQFRANIAGSYNNTTACECKARLYFAQPGLDRRAIQHLDAVVDCVDRDAL
jgi:hypothetical protein